MRRLQFRPALVRDYPAICALIENEQELFLIYPRGQYPFTVEQIHKLARTRHELTVATHDNEIVAFANLYDYKPGTSIHVGNVVVAPSRRGQGIGETLMRHMLNKAFGSYDVPRACLSVFSHNVPALLLYTRLGFVPFGIEERTSFTGERMALVHMGLDRA